MGGDGSPHPGSQSLTLFTLSHILLQFAMEELCSIITATILHGHERSRKSHPLRQYLSCRNPKQRWLSFPNHHAVHVQTYLTLSSTPVHSLGSPHSWYSQQRCWSIVPFLFSEIQTLDPRFRSPSSTCPTVFSHNIQLTSQLANLSNSSGEAILNSLVLSTLSCSLCPQKIWPYTMHIYLARISFSIKLATGVSCASTSHSLVTLSIKELHKQEASLPANHLPPTADFLCLRIHSLHSQYVSLI